MDIRTKLVFALVAVSLGSMLVLGWFSYDAARGFMREHARQHLVSVAETKSEDLHNVGVAWLDRVRLIASRTQLRISLEAHNHFPLEEHRARIERILKDALESVRAVRSIAVFDVEGRVVTMAGDLPAGERTLDIEPFLQPEASTSIQGPSFDPDGNLVMTFIEPVHLEGAPIGAVEVVMSARELIDVTGNYIGLGETGEAVLARSDGQGGAVIVHPLRFDSTATLRRTVRQAGDPILQAVRGNEQFFEEGAVDYRGEPVLAATRSLPEYGWGLVVKVDLDEEEGPVDELRDTMVTLGLSIAAFAIAIGTMLGLYFARPIHALSEVANRIHKGDLDARANADSDDEIGLLARTFNEMAEQLIATNRELERRINERSGEGEAAPPNEGPDR